MTEATKLETAQSINHQSGIGFHYYDPLLETDIGNFMLGKIISIPKFTWELPLGWRVFSLRQKMSGKWICRLQQVSHNIFLYSGGHPTPEIAFENARKKMKDAI